MKPKEKKKAYPRHGKSNTPNTTGRSYNFGNDFWNHRATHGRKKIFESPEAMWESAREYFQSVIDNPLYSVEKHGAGTIKLPRMRPFTMDALCLFLHVTPSYFRDFKLKVMKPGDGFSAVIECIERTVFNQQYEGSASGFLNANIISRALGLVEKQDVTSDNKPLSVPTITVITGNAPKFNNDEKDIKE